MSLNLKNMMILFLKSKLEAKNIFKDAREKVLKDINSKKEILDKQIDEKSKKLNKKLSLKKRCSRKNK